MTKLVDLPKPTWDAYDISTDNPEHDLMESLIVEKNDIFGIEVMYYFADTDNMDRLYGEDPSMIWEKAYKTKMSYVPGDEGDFYNIFGFETNDTIEWCYIPRFTWKRDISMDVEPKVGDLVFTIWNNRVYEVTHSEAETDIFLLKKMVHGLVLRSFRFAEQSASAEELTDSSPISAWGDNDWIETKSDAIDNYPDVDESVYGS